MKRSIFKVAFLAVMLFHSVAAAKLINTPFEYKVIGWTEDSRLWAFSEEGDYGCGMVYSPRVGFYAIDAAKNKFSYKFSETVTSEDDDETKANKKIQSWKRDNLEKIRKMGFAGNAGVVLYAKPKGDWQDNDSTMKQYGEKTVNFKSGPDEYTVKLDDQYKDDATSPWGKRSKFKVSIRKNGGPWKILQEDRSYSREFISCNIIYVSLSPDRKKIAVLVEAIEPGPEGVKNSYFKGITGSL